MRLLLKTQIVLCSIALLGSCTGQRNVTSPTPTPPDYDYTQPSRTLCDATLDLSNGFLCAIRPSRIDSAAHDQFGSSEDNDGSGFGYHAIAFPKTSVKPLHVLIYLGGSFGRPYDQSSSEFPTKTFLEESLTSGYIVIQPAYSNHDTINGSVLCGGHTDVDNCAGLVRLETIRGTDETSIINVPKADSIETRIIKIVDYFSTNGFTFPDQLVSGSAVQWANAAFGGHSQGSGHALYIGKNFGAQSVCIIGGISDVADAVPSVPPENIADWLLDPDFTISKSAFRGFLTQEDFSYSDFTSALTLLGIGYTDVSSPPYADSDGNSINGHAASIKDPRFAAQRAAACFRQ
jgi:hypothetical protein